MKTLITGPLEPTAEDLERLRDLGLDITFQQDERLPVENPEQYEAFIGVALFVFQDISSFKKLKYIQLCSAGKDPVPGDYVREHGIALFNAEGVYSVPMAEWTVMRAMELFKNEAKCYENQKACIWEKDRSQRELCGKTVCIVGYGAYGMETAKRLQALGMTVNVVNRTPKDTPYADDFYSLDKLNRVLPTADLVVLAIGLSEQTRHLFGEQQLAAMKPGAFLINASRGPIVDEKAMISALQNGHLAGAALDVVEKEPLPADSPLWTMPNVLLSPHSSFLGEGNHCRMMEVTVRNLKAFLK